MSPDENDSKKSPMARKQRLLVVFSLAAAVISTGGLAASTLVKSPAQLAAETGPPKSSILTAQVTSKIIATTLVMRGSVADGKKYEFTPTSVAASVNGPGGSVLMVTGVHVKAGSKVHSGQVLAAVSERPVYVLPGAFGAYRDMLPGETGQDIAQLQHGLAGLGFRSRDRSGYFGAGTVSAVKRFYKFIGYPTPLTSEAPAGGGPSTTSGTGSGAASGPASGSASTQPMVPMSEVMFVPSLPARVLAINAQVGDKVDGAMLALTAGGLNLTGQMNPADASNAKVGMRVTVDSEATGYHGAGTISSIGKQVTPKDGPGYIPVHVKASTSWPDSIDGQDVRVTITTETSGKPVMAVPVAAISSTPSGDTTVTVFDAAHNQHVVPVVVGASADGWVQITSPDGSVSIGNLVVTGQ